MPGCCRPSDARLLPAKRCPAAAAQAMPGLCRPATRQHMHGIARTIAKITSPPLLGRVNRLTQCAAYRLQPTWSLASPTSVGLLHRRFASSLPMTASSKTASVRSTPSNVVPVMMALTNLVPIILEPVKSTRSMTPLVRSAPDRLASCAYAFVSTASCMSAFEKSASDISAPARTLARRLPPVYEHLRRSSSLSETALAWPMVLPK
mmetsp:Transcript_30599/g.90720  ORF Transcript_30599/g.90720 Transcript_30599/m.90720 type:complete len:206 (+) Transcript_30599:1011-1628(+)